MKNSKNSRNITKSFIRKSTSNSHEVKDAKYYEDAKGNKYYVDGKNVVIDYSVSEKNVANWLKETFGGEIYICYLELIFLKVSKQLIIFFVVKNGI